MNKAKPMPPMERLDCKFYLDRDRGLLVRKETYSQNKAGAAAGTRMASGHWQTAVDGKRYLVHRIIYFMATGVDPLDMRVDHINGDPADNRPENLRLATVAENTRHKTKLASNNESGHRNVSWNNYWQRWQVSVTVNNKRIQRSFREKLEAIACATELRLKHYGEFAGIAP